MTRLLTTGYETGDVNEAGVTTTGTGGAVSVVNTTPTPRAGAYCLKVAASAGTMNATYKTFTLPAAKTDVWIRFAAYMHPAAVSAEVVIAASQDAAGGSQNCLTWDPVSGAIRARLNNITTGTLLATGSTALPPDTWHVIDWRIQITSTTVGVVEVWLDGNRIINFSGDNSNTTTANVQFFALGHTGTSVASATGLYMAFDDIAVNDTAGTVNNTRAGDGRVILLLPTGAGSSTQWVRGGTDSGANWSQVSEVPPSMAQYVSSPTAGNRDLYAVADLPVAVLSINVVEALALAQNSDAGAGSLGPTIKSGATTNEATAVSLGTTAGYVTGRWELDPNGNVAWTGAAVNAAEVGVTVR